ncbi:hypothetical protein LDC_1424 [sediment metagenome]|uniref:Uncharacterized protein n=1 Tax=sediment metagenome TaxID=749907 RepID=D9PIR6_9ZZZZ
MHYLRIQTETFRLNYLCELPENSGMRTPNDLADPHPIFWRVGLVARTLGISKRMLIDEAESGRLPMRIVRFGKAGVAHVLAQEAVEVLRSLNSERTK